MYSSGNPTNMANPIKDATFQVDIKTISGRLTLYQTTLCEKLPWDKLNSNAKLDPKGYLDAYNKNDVQFICCQADANVLWLIPDVVRTRFVKSLDSGIDMDITFAWVLTRDRPKGKEVVKYDGYVGDQYLPDPSDVQKVLNGSSNSFRIYNVYDRFFRVTGSGEIRALELEVCKMVFDYFSLFIVLMFSYARLLELEVCPILSDDFLNWFSLNKCNGFLWLVLRYC